MLTRQQYALLKFIDITIRLKGGAPSFDEMKLALGLRSKSGIHRLISALTERGFIRRLPSRARAIEVIYVPQVTAPEVCPHCGSMVPRRKIDLAVVA